MRPWFQYHLSTCVVITLALGAIIGVNVATESETLVAETSSGAYVYTYHSYGWPRQVYYSYSFPGDAPPQYEIFSEFFAPHWVWNGLLYNNTFAGVPFLLVFGVVRMAKSRMNRMKADALVD